MYDIYQDVSSISYTWFCYSLTLYLVRLIWTGISIIKK